MAFAACVTYDVLPGHAPAVRERLIALREHTLTEPGCLAYEPHHDPADPSRWFLYELYVDEAAYHAHRASAYFARYVLDGMAEHLADRRVEIYEPLAAEPFPR